MLMTEPRRMHPPGRCLGHRQGRAGVLRARSRMRAKISQLEEGFTGHPDDHHRFLLRQMLGRIDTIDADIAAVDAQIEVHLIPFAQAAQRLDEIPGIGPVAAAIIIAETGLDMTRFPTAPPLFLAEFAPGSSPRPGSTRAKWSTGHGSRYLARVHGEAAVATGGTDTFLGVDHYDRHVDTGAKKRSHIRQLEALDSGPACHPRHTSVGGWAPGWKNVSKAITRLWPISTRRWKRSIGRSRARANSARATRPLCALCTTTRPPAVLPRPGTARA